MQVKKRVLTYSMKVNVYKLIKNRIKKIKISFFKREKFYYKKQALLVLKHQESSAYNKFWNKIKIYPNKKFVAKRNQILKENSLY